MNDQELKKLIQQSRAIQGYLSYTPAQLEQALGGWKKGLEELPTEQWASAINAAMTAYQAGPFNPAYVRKIYYQNCPQSEVDEAGAITAMKHLAMEVIGWPESEMKQNILKPIAEWVGRRPKDVALRVWEKKVLDAVKPETTDRTA